MDPQLMSLEKPHFEGTLKKSLSHTNVKKKLQQKRLKLTMGAGSAVRCDPWVGLSRLAVQVAPSTQSRGNSESTFSNFLNVFICLCAHFLTPQHARGVRELEGVSSLLLLCRFQVSKSGRQA